MASKTASENASVSISFRVSAEEKAALDKRLKTLPGIPSIGALAKRETLAFLSADSGRLGFEALEQATSDLQALAKGLPDSVSSSAAEAVSTASAAAVTREIERLSEIENAAVAEMKMLSGLVLRRLEAVEAESRATREVLVKALRAMVGR